MTANERKVEELIQQIEKEWSEARERKLRAYAAKIDPRDRSRPVTSPPGPLGPPMAFPSPPLPSLTQARTLLAATSMRLSRQVGRGQDDISRTLLEDAAEIQQRNSVTFAVALETAGRQLLDDIRRGVR